MNILNRTTENEISNLQTMKPANHTIHIPFLTKGFQITSLTIDHETQFI